MTIKSLQLSNFQVIKDFHYDFSGNIYFITGDNEKGKSTILKAIGVLLDGKRDEVLKNGEEKGFAKMVVGDDGKEYQVELNFTKKNPRGTITIKSDGMKSENISMLQKIFGYTDFDAVEFSRWSETAEGRRKQVDIVKSLLPKGVQERIEQIDLELENHRGIRKDYNAEVKTFTNLVNAAEKEFQPGDLEKYSEKIPTEKLLEDQEKRIKTIEKAKTIKANYKIVLNDLEEMPNREEKLKNDFDLDLEKNSNSKKELSETYEKKLEDLKKEYDNFLNEIERKEKEIRKNFDDSLISISDAKKELEEKKNKSEAWIKQYDALNLEDSNISDEIKEAQKHNEIHQKVLDYHSKKNDLKNAEEKAQKEQNAMMGLIDEKDNLISSSSLPIEGLSFNDEGLQLNGVPFIAGKVSDSQIMEIAMKFTVAINKNVKVFRIARGESLGKERLQNIIDFANKNGFQGFFENVVRGQEELQIEEYNVLEK